MKRRLVLFICLALNAGILTGIQAQSTPVPTPVVSRVIGQDIFVRGGPGRAYMPVGRLVEGDRVKPVSRNTSADWVLIVYRNGFGWIRRDLADWIEDIDALPVIRDDSLTPSPTSIQSVTATPAELFILPTQTPTGNWVQLGPDVASGYVRAGPGRTYLRLGQLLTGDIVEPVGRNADSTWIMIRFGNGFGWIARNLARWVVVVDDLPVVDPVNLTPSQTFTASFTPSSTATLTSTPTYTATATATATPTSTATSTVTLTLTRTPSPTSSSTATFTPSSTSTASFTPTFTLTATPTASLTPSLTATLTPSFTATSTFTATPSATFTSWPIVTNTFAPRLTETSVSAAVSSLTLTPTVSPSPTSVPSSSPAPTDTPTPTPTLTVTPSFTVAPTSTATASPSPTATPATILMAPSATSTRVFTVSAVPTSTAVQTRTPLPTQTSQPTNTPTASVTTTLTRTPLPTPTNQPTNTPTASVTTTLTRTPLPTRTSVPTHTPTTRVTATQRVTLTLTATSTATLTRTATARGTITQVAIGSPTLMLSPTAIRPTVTPQSEIIVLVTEVPTAFASATITSLPQVSPTLIPTTPTMPLRPTPPASAQRDSVLNVPVEAWVGGIVLLGLLAYVGLYLRGQAQLDRYQNGFVVDRCPVCQRGRLIIEDRRERVVGIPRPRRIVRCDDCRSVLRETGSRRWRYAIDPLEDIELYRRYNGQAIDEQTLVELSRRASVPPRVSDQLTESPQFDDET